MMICSMCGQNHEHQVEDYPVGSIVRAKDDFDGAIRGQDSETGQLERHTIYAGSYGEVVNHCNDGRAVIEFDDDERRGGHTFHYPDGYFEAATKEETLAYRAMRDKLVQVQKLLKQVRGGNE